MIQPQRVVFVTEDEARGVVGAATQLGSKLIGSLPAQFLMLCLLNLIFILGLLWFIHQREMQRERLLSAYLASCERQVPMEAIEKLLQHLGPFQAPAPRP
jgi:hypothetical protein